MKDEIKCPNILKTRQCGRKAIRTKDSSRPGLSQYWAHYECARGHKFHIRFPQEKFVACDCLM
jgi:hypothetical protein